jgi:hypothetical protein
LTRGDGIGRAFGLDRVRTRIFPIAWQVPWGISPASLPGLPLPAKITMQVCEPMPWSSYGAGAAEDPEIVQYCFDEITDVMQRTLDGLVAEHPWPVLSRLAGLLPHGGNGREG